MLHLRAGRPRAVVCSSKGICLDDDAAAAQAAQPPATCAFVQEAASRPAPAAAPVQLRCLHLHQCQVDDVAELASDSLLFMTTALSSWPGAWPAAALAWPQLQRLVLWCPGSSGSSSSTCSGARRDKGWSISSSAAAATASAATCAAAAAAEAMALIQQLPCFSKLQQLELQHLPSLTADCLSVACTKLPALRHLKISAALVGSNAQELVTAVEKVGSSIGSCRVDGGHTTAVSLKTLSLHVPGQLAPSLVRHHQYLLQQQQPHAGAAEGLGAADRASVDSRAEDSRLVVTLLDAFALQASLQQILPWGVVRVMSDQPGLLC